MSATAEAVERLSRGERAWFWFARTPRSGAPLRLYRLRDDPTGRALLQESAGDAPLDEAPILGFLQVDEGGRLHFVSTQGSERVLRDIAAMVHREVGQHPALARLRGATMTLVSGGVALGRVDDAALWAGLPMLADPGPLPQIATELRGLQPGEQRFFWLTGDGPGDLPLMLLGDPARDSEGAGFARAIRVARRGCPPGGLSVSGVMKVLASGRLCFTTDDTALSLRAAMARLLRSGDPLPALVGAVLIEPGGQSTFSPASMDQALVAAPLTEARVFWLTDAAVHGEAQLALAPDPQELRRLAEVARGRGQSWRGALSTKAGLHLQISSDTSAAQAALDAFLRRTALVGLPPISLAPREA